MLSRYDIVHAVDPLGNHLSMVDPTGTLAPEVEDRNGLPDRNSTVYA